jgi:Asp-tRNA(Asn)/Glu-tRNA(Gln) amidotransferase A subunit family amidase
MDATVGPDPDDPITQAGAGHYPIGGASYVKALDGSTLRGARLGALTVLFGEAPEDQRAGSVVRMALQEMASAGASVVPIALADPPREADGVAIIRHEFKFDLEAYLAKTPGAPVRSLAEILDKRLIHSSLETAFRGSAEIATLDSDAYRAIVTRNAALRDELIKTMEDNRVVALVYPTLRRTAAKIGEPQPGGNCAASAATGLPSITVPAGFADDGMPVGVEFLGRPFSEVDLLTVAFAYEQATRHRRPPTLTPALNRH